MAEKVPPQRVLLANSFNSRDAGMTKGALLTNCYQENYKTVSFQDQKRIVKRPGYDLLYNNFTPPVTSQGIITYNNQLVTIGNDVVNIGTGPVVPPTFTTWNPLDKASTMVLSNGNLTTSSTSNYGSVRSTISKSSSKWYWEIHVDSSIGNVNAMSIAGIATAAVNINNQFTITPVSYGDYIYAGGTFFNTSGSRQDGPASATLTTGDVLGIALDLVNNSITFYKNGVLTVTMSILAGTYFAAICNSSGVAVHSVTTANFGNTAFSYSPPSGFRAGLYTEN